MLHNFEWFSHSQEVLLWIDITALIWPRLQFHSYFHCSTKTPYTKANEKSIFPPPTNKQRKDFYFIFPLITFTQYENFIVMYYFI